MKKILLILLAVALFGVPGASFAACQKGSFGKIQGPTAIQLGETYTYSVRVNGNFRSGRWSITGGQLLKDWSEGDIYYGKVKWKNMDPNDPSKVKVFGKDSCGKERAERLYVTVGGSRAPGNGNSAQCGSFTKIQGPETVVFGQVYTYSTVVTGSFTQGDWSATGGDVVKKWWDGSTYYAQVKWKTNNPKDPSKLKIWGDDVCGKQHVNQKLYITEAASRGALNGNGDTGDDAGGVEPPQQTHTKGVTLFSSMDYQGLSETYTHDVSDFENTAMGHDRALSIRVPSGCEAILYSESQYQGEREIFTKDVPNLYKTRVGRSASSLKLSCN